MQCSKLPQQRNITEDLFLLLMHFFEEISLMPATDLNTVKLMELLKTMHAMELSILLKSILLFIFWPICRQKEIAIFFLVLKLIEVDIRIFRH